jgi:hypothetical protein
VFVAQETPDDCARIGFNAPVQDHTSRLRASWLREMSAVRAESVMIRNERSWVPFSGLVKGPFVGRKRDDSQREVLGSVSGPREEDLLWAESVMIRNGFAA